MEGVSDMGEGLAAGVRGGNGVGRVEGSDTRHFGSEGGGYQSDGLKSP